MRGWRFETPDGDVAIEQAALDGPARALFRPEAATIALDETAGLRGEVQAVSYRGTTSSVTIRLASGTVSVQADPVLAAGLSEGGPGSGGGAAGSDPDLSGQRLTVRPRLSS